MSKKILLAAGCSYTEESFFSMDNTIPDEQRGGWPMWPEILGDTLGLDVINVGLSNAGTDYMFDSIIKQISIYGDRIDAVAVLWSGCERFQLFNWRINPPMELRLAYEPGKIARNSKPFVFMDDIWGKKLSVAYWASKRFSKNTYKTMIENHLSKILAIMKICKGCGIKVIMYQGVMPFDNSAYNFKEIPGASRSNAQEIYKWWISSPMFSEIQINHKNFIGWPIFPSLGGHYYDNISSTDRTNQSISPRDGHPNALGQEALAETFIDGYRKSYE